MKQQYLIELLFITVAILPIVGCTSDVIEPAQIDQSYFPLSTGKYIIYDVDSTDYDDFHPLLTYTAHYQVKEYIDSAYEGASGETLYRIERSRRNTENDPWVLTDVWSANLTVETAEKVEENLRYIKLDFPVLNGKNWLGNSLIADSVGNGLEEYGFHNWDYEYTDTYYSLVLNGLSFDSVITVLQHEDANAIDSIYYEEKYARGVGLIWKKEKFWLDDNSNSIVDPYGWEIIMTVREYN